MFYQQPPICQVLTEHGRARQKKLPRCFTVCVWNWQKSKQKAWKQEFLALAKATDLFLAQEVRRSPIVQQLMEQTTYRWSGAVSFFSLTEKTPIGVATGSIAAPQKLLFARGAQEPFFKMPKMTLAAFIPLEGSVHPLLAVNIHAINFTGLKPFAQNLQRALQLLQNYPGPVLLGGDFNAWSAKRRQLLQEVVKTAGLTEVSFEPDVRTHCLGLPVDYLFVRGLTVRTAGVRETLGSDHNPLLARLEVC